VNNIPLKNFSDYFFENISVGYNRQIQISSICNAKCIFCSNDQNPFEVKRCSFRPLEEIEKVVWAASDIRGSIQLNESLPGRISEGEAFLHPDFDTIMRVIRNKFKNEIKITTNGSLLTEDFIKHLEEFNPLEITISFPTIDKEHWKESFTLLNDHHYNIVVNSFLHLSNHNIKVFANIVPMPSWLGWNELEETFKFLSTRVQYIHVYAPGYTKHSKIIDKLKYDKMELSLFLNDMSIKYGFTYQWELDPRLVLGINYDLITNNIMMSYKDGNRNFLWLTSTSAKERFEILLEKLCVGVPINNIILEVKNDIYGGNIECSGLWMIQDVDKALVNYLNNNPHPDQIFLPKNFLDMYGFDLCSINILDLLKKYSGIRIGLL
jgi:wyosine [tRNA(Phe)-imidazoG37] synthetase (radical SAM superfamily)